MKNPMLPKTLIVIPARLQAQRLPNKPLAQIANKPMIQHVWERACQGNLGNVVVACGDPEIAEVIEKAGGNAILTDPSLASGTDRVYTAWKSLDPEEKIYDAIVNVQGDLPTLDPKIISSTVKALHATPEADITTPVTKIKNKEEFHMQSVVKVATGSFHNMTAKAVYFSRSCIPYGAKERYHHVGLYAFRPPSLSKFVNLPVSKLEKEEKLEQLRALEAGLSIYVTCVDTDTPFGIDTPEDLKKVRNMPPFIA